MTIGAASSSVNITLNQDNVALEPSESFTLQLAANLDPPFFFMNNLNVTIVDRDGNMFIDISNNNYYLKMWVSTKYHILDSAYICACMHAQVI